MFFYNKNQLVNEKRQKFSIRKYKVGTFSVVVGALFYLNGISNMVQATEVFENSVPTSVEEKQSGESKKVEEPQQPKIQEAVNTTATQLEITEKTKIEAKKETPKAEVKQGDVAVDSMSERPAAASKVETKPVLENKETQKESAENEAFIQELNQILLEGKSLESNVHVAFRLEVEQLVKEMEEATKNSKSITKDIIEQYKEKIQNLKKKNDEYQNGLNEKVNKIKALKEEINSISSSIQYTLEPQETALLKVVGEFSVLRQTVEEADGLITSLKQLRNKVANLMTREHSGKRDPRNGQPIAGKGESGFRAITLTPIANMYEGSNVLVNEYKKDVTYYNGDTIFSVIQVSGKRGAGEPIVRYQYGTNKGKEDPTPYYIKRVGIINGLEYLTGVKLRVAYKDFQTGQKKEVEITSQYWNVNNPDIQMAFVGTIGNGGNVRPGTYHITLGANGTNRQATITYTFTIKSQSERNTVRDLTPTYVDDVRHLTEAERTALIEKFKAEHPDVVKRAHHIDFERAEVSADGATMTIHFKDGFDTKTIQTNAQNDVEAKHSSLTTLVGDPHEFYKNPRNLVKSKTNHEVPQTARVTWKTPFDFSQPGTKNAVVTVSYDNGVTKDVTTPYTVLDFIGKQDKRIYQNQSGELGDARSYITLSNGTAPATDLTIRWKGGSSVDTSAQGTQRKEIEILRGNTVMKTVTIPVAIVDNINPTITAPDSVLLTRAEGLPSNISIDAQDNARGIGLKDANPVVVENLANPLRYNPSTKRIELSGVIPNNFQRTQATIKAVDKNGNTATKTITFNVQAQTDKYNAVANPQKQTVSYMATPSAEASVSTTGLPTGTRYTWKITPNTSSPGDKTGVVEITYPDTSKDTVNVTVSVRKLSDEYAPTGNKIVKNQNVSVTNDDLKAAVTINNNGNSKVKSVTLVGTISTVNAGTQTINATVTYLDDTTDSVTIPLEVKDVTAPTIQTPSDRQNWDLIALDRTLPSITVTSADNNGGTGVKSTTVTGLPDFLVYDNTTKTIKFKNGVQEVTKLPAGQDSKTHTATIQVTDNANNTSQRQVTITVKSMTTKYNAIPNTQKQTVSYGDTPDAGTSINKTGLPAGTTYTWATTPATSTTTPGDKQGVVTVTYPDGSKDTVNVTVNVRRLADEYEPTGTKILKNQNDSITNDELKAAVTISNNGNSKVKSVTPVGTISTAEFGNKTINAIVTYLDDTTDSVTIPLEVKDVTAPTIQTPSDRQNWDLIAVEGQNPNIAVTSEDNAGGSGVKTTTVTGLPDFLVYDEATKTIKFKTGVTKVPSLPEGTDVQSHNITIEVEDNAGNKTSTQVTITVKSMTTKYDATPNPDKQTVSYGATPDAGTSVNTSGLPEGTSYAWKTTPDTNTPGEKDGVVEVTYKDGSKDTVNVKVNVNKLSDEYNVTGAPIEVNQNTPVTNDDLKAKVTATSKEGNVSGTDKISKVEPKAQVSTAAYGETNIEATVTFKDGTTKDVTIPLKVKDVTNPTIQAPTNGQNWNLIAVEGQDPNIAVTSEDNAGGSGVKTTTVTGLPDFLAYDEATKTIKFKTGVTKVPSLPEGTDVQSHNITIEVEDNAGNKTSTQVTITVKSMTTKYDATPNPDKQTVSYGATPDAGTSVNTSGLPEGTSYAWKTTPDTNTPGEKDGVVEVTYKDGSKDTVNVKVNVNKLSDEYNVTGAPIEVNQNTPVTNDDLKAKVTATSKEGNVSGTDKISKVEPKAQVSTAAYGETNIEATVTFKDGTTKDVTIPLKVKDVTNPTIQAPTNGQNWDLIAVEGQDPNIAVTSEDNAGGSGVKTTTVTGLPDFLVYDEATKTIKFKTGVTKVPSLPEGTDVQSHNITIEVEDNAGNKTSTQVTITVKSMTTKYDATPNPDKQTVSYGATPDAGTSVNTSGLPEGTSYAWKTTPDTNTPGEKDGVVEVTYKDGSKDVVTVNVTVRKVSEDFTANGTQIEVNQNVSVTPEMLKGAVTATNVQGENGNAKIAKVESKVPINTEAYGEQTIQAKVTYIDGSEQDVTIPLKVKDVTNPTIQTPVKNTNWEITALDKTLPSMKIKAEDNANGSGIATIEVNNMPEFLTFDESTGTIVFKEGIQEVPKIESDSIMYGVTITARDKAGNSTSTLVNITVWSMRGKYTPTVIPQTVDNGHVPNAEESVNKTGLPEGTTVTWKTTPEVSTPGSHPGVALVHYPDGTEDEVEVPVTVKEQKETFNPTAKEPNQTVRHNEVPDPAKSINTNGLPEGTTYTWSEQPNTSTPGSKPGKVLITYPDKSTEEVPVTVEVTPQKDEYTPTAIPQTVDNGHVPNAEESVNKTGLPEGTTVTWKTTPEVSTPGSHPGVALVHYPDGTEDEVEVPVTVKEQKETFNPTAKEPNQTVRHNEVPDPAKSINTNGLPEGTTYTWSEQPNTSTPGSKPGKVLITYPDKSTEEVPVTVEVTPQKDEYTPTAIPQTVDNGHVPNAEESVNKTGLPEGTRVTWKETPVVNTPGSHPTVALVTYPDGTVDEVTVPITVKEQKDTFNPTAKQPNQTAKHGSDPSAEGSINTDGLPSGTTYTWVEKPDTNTTPGSKPGKVLITYPDKSTEEVPVTVEVTPQKDEYTPTAIPQTVDNGHVPNAEESVNKTGLPEGTTVTWKTTPEVSTPGSHPGVALVHYPDGTEDEVEVPVTVKEQKETFNPTAKEPNQMVRHNEVPDPAKSINTNGLPEGTTYTWSEQPNTSTPGSKPGKVLITYPDKSTEEVPVTVEVTPQKDEYTPTGIPQEVDNGHVPDPETSVNKTGLPEGTTVTWKTTPDVSTPGSHPGVALVHYPDGTEDEVEVPVTVKEQKETFNPTAKEPNQTVRHNEVPDPAKSINTNGLPEGTTYTWSEQPNTSTPGSKPGKVLITYPDKSTEEVPVTVEVTPQKDEYTPTAIPQTVDNGHVPNAEESVNKTGLPEGTTVTWKTTPEVSTPGSHPGVALVHYPDGTEDEVEVPVTVKEQKETFNPTAKEPNQTVRHNEVPDPAKSINTNGLPEGTTYTWSEQPNTSTPGSKPGKVLITYPDKSTEEVPVTVEVTPQKDEYTPTAIPQTVDNGHVPNAEESVNKTGLPEGTRVTWKETPVVNTPGSHPTVALVTYPDGTVDEVTVPITVKEQKDTFNPTAKQPNQTAKHGSDPSAEGSINTDGLPSGTTYTWVEKPDTNTTPGSKPGKVLITYPDKSTEEVPVTVEVTPQKDEYTPTAIPQTVDNGHVPNAEESVNKTGLPEGTTVTWKTTPEVSTPGSHPGVALVHYPDGTEDEVEVPVTVKEQKETFNPTAKEPNQMVRHNEVPDPAKSINTNGLPEGTTYTWSEQPNTSTPGSKPGKVLITYPDNSTEEVSVTVEVTPQKDEYTPTAIPQTVDNGHVPNAEESVNKTGLPEGTTVTWKTTPDVSTPGSHPGVALVHYPDGTEDEVDVPVTVKEQKETFNPTAKEPNQTVRHNEVPDPAKSINTNGLPEGTTYTWSEQPNTSTPGSKPGKVLITYPDKSTEEVPVTVEVTPQKDEYTPTAIPQTVDNGHVPNAEESVNKTGLPEGTTVTWKTTPEVSTPGSHPGVALVHYPDGTEDEVEVPVTVKDSDTNGTPETQPEVPDFTGGVNTPDAPINEVPSYTDPIGSTGIDENGNIIEPPVVELPTFSGGVNGEPETQPEVPEFSGGANTPDTPIHEESEFNGEVNGELPNPVESPKVKLIMTRWIDENGNELKPSDAKVPKVLGEENEEFEHGEIEGFEFVKTEKNEDGDIVTHIFRKRTVQSDSVSEPNRNIHSIVEELQQTPNDTQATQSLHEQQTSEDRDVRQTKEKQKILPKTGMGNELKLFSSAVASILLGLGFILPSKKEEE